jgi:hypothetical protein
VHWGRNSLFGDGSGGDAFRHFFEPVNDLTLADLANLPPYKFYPPKWRADTLSAGEIAKWQGEGSRMGYLGLINRPEQVIVADFYAPVANLAGWIAPGRAGYRHSVPEIYRRLLAQYLRPAAPVRDAVAAFRQRHLPEPFLTLHLRGTDKAGEQASLTALNDQILDRALAMLSERPMPVFVMTDDAGLLDAAGFRLGATGQRVVHTDCIRGNGRQGVHLVPQADRVRLGLETMVDFYIGAEGARFVGNGGSNPAALLSMIKDWAKEDCHLVWPNASLNLLDLTI